MLNFSLFKKNSNYFKDESASRSNLTILSKLRMRSLNRTSDHEQTNNDQPGLCSLINLGVLAGAGAGLLRNSNSNINSNNSLFGSKSEKGQNCVFNDDLVTRKPKQILKQQVDIKHKLPIQKYLEKQVGLKVL